MHIPVYLSGTVLIIKIDGIEKLHEWAIGFAQNPKVVEDFIQSVGIYKTCDIYDSGLIHIVFVHDIVTTLKEIRGKLRSYGFMFGGVRTRKTPQNPGQILAHYRNHEETKIYSENVPKANTIPDDESTTDDSDCDNLGDMTEKMQDMYITHKNKLIKVFTKHHWQMEILLDKQKIEIEQLFDKIRKDTEESLKNAIKKHLRFQYGR